MSFLIYFKGLNPEFILNMTPDHLNNLMALITKHEEDYGIIGKTVDEYKVSKKQSSVTVTPNNIDKVKGSLKSISDTSRMLHKKRNL